MRLFFGAVLALGLVTGCGEVREFKNVKVEAVNGAFTITDENGHQEMVSDVTYSTDTGAAAHSGEVSSMVAEQVITICCAECHSHGDGTIHCTGCSFC